MKKELKTFIFWEFAIWALTVTIMALIGNQFAKLSLLMFILTEVLVLLLGVTANALNAALLYSRKISRATNRNNS